MMLRVQKKLIRNLFFIALLFVSLMGVALNGFVVHAANVKRFASEAFPLLAQNFEWIFGALSIALFCTLATVIGITFWRTFKPLKKILAALEQDETFIEDERLLLRSDEFGFLARKINSLSEKATDEEYLLSECHRERKALVEGLDEGVVLFNEDLKAILSNRSAQKILKVPKKDFVSKNFQELTDTLPAPLFKQIHRMLRRSLETLSVHTEIAAIGGHISLRACPVPSGKGVVLTLRDSAQEHKVMEMGRDFIANASHEMRTPITIIRGFAETLNDLSDIPPNMLEGILEKIMRNCDRMNHLVAHLLTLADLDGESSIRLHDTDLVSLLDNCNQILLTLHPDTFIEILHNKEAIELPMDGNLFELAVTNLLQNAVKYSDGNASIRVTVEDRESDVLIKITDKGIGIPAADLPHIFGRFYTVDKAHSRSLGGAGLGLSIVRRIVEKHNGTIHASSVQGQGTTFSIVLPKIPAAICQEQSLETPQT